MSRRILILGGTGYFGKHLVNRLLINGDEVTLATRGNSSISLGCNHISFDRNTGDEFPLCADYDVVYDQSCYLASSMSNLKKLMLSCGKYIFTSSQSVYKSGINIHEHSVDYDNCNINSEMVSVYGVEKRKAEAIVATSALDYAIVRFPVVVGMGDPRRRIQALISKIMDGEVLVLPHGNPMLNVIEEREAAMALYELGFKRVTGAINIANRNPISVEEMCLLLSVVLDKSLSIVRTPHFISEGFDLIKCHTKTLNLDKMTEIGISSKTVENVLSCLAEKSRKHNAE